MNRLETLRSALDILLTERTQLTASGWCLQHCWLVQVKPGGNARTDRKYWQVRSRQAIFAGKKLKHLHLEDVETYRAAIERGRKLKQIDRRIKTLQRQLVPAAASSDSALSATRLIAPNLTTNPLPPREKSAADSVLIDIAEQDRLVQEVLAKSKALRAALRQSVTLGHSLGAKSAALRKQFPPKNS